MFLLNIIVFILVLGVIILIHELGHFYFAKKANILCHEFSIGMGPVIYQKRKGETVYSIRSIPIGGFVSMAGESVSDALIKKDMVIGVKLNTQGLITHIYMIDSLDKDFVGMVKAFDLYGKDFNPLFIDLEVNGELKHLSVARDAMYVLGQKKQMWITPSEKSFESKTLWQRFMVIFAGPLMNFILALFLYLIVGFFILKPNLDSSEISYVAPESPAFALGLEVGDVITSINGENVTSWNDLSFIMASLESPLVTVSYQRDDQTYEETTIAAVIIQSAGISNVSDDGTRYSDVPIVGRVFGRADTDSSLEAGDEITHIIYNGVSFTINDWDDVIHFFAENNSGSITIRYQRESEIIETTYKLISASALERLGYSNLIFQLGISPTSSSDLGYSLMHPLRSFSDDVMQVVHTIGLLADPNEDLGLGDLSGPIGIFSLVSQTTAQGLLSILSFTAFLSINIGLLNLLPIPALDGGRLVFLGIEAITRKPLNRKVENTINNVMFFLLIGLFIFVAYNDIMRLILGS